MNIIPATARQIISGEAMEQAATSVKVVEVCRVAPLPTTTPTISLPLTFFDIDWLRIPPAESVIFYEYPNLTSSFFESSIVPNLKHSLSLTLQHFLPIAGSIIWPIDSPYPIINYVPGNSVSLTIAQSSNTDNFNTLSSSNTCVCVASQLEPLIPHFTTSHEAAPVLTLQLTLFPSSGFSLGIAAHHAAMDGKAFALFLKAWAYSCSNYNLTEESSSLPKHLTPFYDRSMIRDTAGIGAMVLEDLLNHGGRSVKSWDHLTSAMSTEAIRGSFELTSSNIQKLKEHAKDKLRENINDAPRFSTFQVTCAFVLQCWAKAEQPKTNGVGFVFNVDCRSRLEQPIPSTYFGNCVIGHKVMDETKNWLGDDGFINALMEIREALNRLEDPGVLLSSEVVTFSTMKQILIDYKITSAAWSPRFDVYSIDFGWGRPKKMDMTSIRKSGGFCLSESRNGNGGVEISLVLNRQQMETFTAHFTEGLESL